MSKITDPRILEQSLSAARLSTYIKAVGAGGGKAEAQAIELYLWNARVSAAFLLPLQICEVALRNAVAQAIANTYGEHWPWHQGFQGSLPNQQEQVLSKAVGTVKQKNTGKLIPELSFSFWQNMLTRRHDDRIWNNQLALVFPAISAETSVVATYRSDIYQRLDKIRKLRNRIAHHEPIFQRNLAQDIANVLHVLCYRCPETADWLEREQTVLDLLTEKPILGLSNGNENTS